MKHCLKIFILFSLVIVVSQSCKKVNDAQPNQSNNSTPADQDVNSVLSRISVNSNGYLVFSNRRDLQDYSSLLHSSKKEMVLSSMKSKGFLKKQTNSSVFSKDGDDPYAEFFDQDGLLQVEDILIKISSDEKFLYIIKEQNLDPETYSKLISETYDVLKMNKITVDQLELNFDLLAMVDYTPFGINEPEDAIEGKKPMFGTTHTPILCHVPGDEPGTCYYWLCNWDVHYTFWIPGQGHWGADIPNSGYSAACP